MDDVLKLPETLDTGGAMALRSDLLAHRGKPTHLDASAVTRMTGFAAEVLVAARKQSAADGTEFLILDASDCFLSTIADLGLTGTIPASQSNAAKGDDA